MYFTKFEKFPTIISWSIFSALYSFCILSDTLMTWMLDLLSSHKSLSPFLFLFLFVLDNFSWSLLQLSDSFLYHLHCYWDLTVIYCCYLFSFSVSRMFLDGIFNRKFEVFVSQLKHLSHFSVSVNYLFSGELRFPGSSYA